MQNMPGKYQVAFSTNGPTGYNLCNPQQKRQRRKAKKKYNIHTTSDEKITPDPIVATKHSINTAVIGLPMRMPNPAFMAAITGMPAPATHNRATIPEGVCISRFLDLYS